MRNYLGLALIPQAGVAIGLAALGARTLGGQEGEALETIILASSVLYELIGPACAKLSLYLSKSYSVDGQTENEAPAPEEPALSPVDRLVREIQQIQASLPPRVSPPSEEEAAFTEAAEEQYDAIGNINRRHRFGRRF